MPSARALALRVEPILQNAQIVSIASRLTIPIAVVFDRLRAFPILLSSSLFLRNSAPVWVASFRVFIKLRFTNLPYIPAPQPWAPFLRAKN